MNRLCSICKKSFHADLPSSVCDECFGEVPAPAHIERHLEGHGFKLSGQLHVTVRDAKTGDVLQDYVNGNLIVDTGLDMARDLLGSGNHAPSHIAVGDDATAPTAADTLLANEVFRKAITQTDFDPGAIVQFIMFLDTGDANGFTLREAGLFNTAGSNQVEMFSRVPLVPEIDKDSGITVTLSWQITVVRA